MTTRSQHVGRIQASLLSNDKYAEWPATLITDDGGVFLLSSVSVPRTGEGLFGPGTIFLDAGKWKLDDREQASPTALELNPSYVVAVVART